MRKTPSRIARAVLKRPIDIFASSQQVNADFAGPPGTTFTESAQGRVATFVGNENIAYGFFSKGGSLLSDGTGDWLTFPDSTVWAPTAGQAYEWSFLVYTAVGGGSTYDLLSQATGAGAYPIRLTIDTTFMRPQWLAFNSSSSLVLNLSGASNCIVLNRVQLVTFTTDGTTFRIFVDGAQVASTTITAFNHLDNAVAMQVGSYNSSSYNGRILAIRYTLGQTRHVGSFIPPRRAESFRLI